jgi:hypothetical protein
MKFDRYTPCKHCPFRTDMEAYRLPLPDTAAVTPDKGATDGK